VKTDRFDLRLPQRLAAEVRGAPRDHARLVAVAAFAGAGLVTRAHRGLVRARHAFDCSATACW